MKGILKFINEARTELLKVTWPSRNAAIGMTLTVIAIAILFSLYVAGADLLITQAVKWVSNKASTTQSANGANNIQVQTTPTK